MRKDERKLKHLSDVIWECPFCHNETVRYDQTKKLFVCWECCKTLSFEEGTKILSGFKVSDEYFTYD
jgi:ribosomal protein S27E